MSKSDLKMQIFKGFAQTKTGNTIRIDRIDIGGYNIVITLEGEMIKRLRKVGNSNALILDKPILELLGLAEGGEVQLTIQDGNLIVTPARPQHLDPKSLDEKLDYIIKKRRKVLKRLAQ